MKLSNQQNEFINKKNQLRKMILKNFERLNPAQCLHVSSAVCERLAHLEVILNAKHMGFFSATNCEIDLYDFACLAKQRGVELYYPRFNKKFGIYEMAIVYNINLDFTPGYLGIAEPKAMNPRAEDEIVLHHMTWFIPGLGFDGKGNRLGRGKGYYDTLLEKAEGNKIGIAYDWQILKGIPIGTNDVAMDYIVTESRTLDCSR